MNKEYYLIEDGERTGPYTYNQLINMDLTIHTEIITPKSDEPQLASELPEFIDYFEAQGVYFPTGDNLAPFSSRTFAFILDYFLVSMVVMLILIKLGLIVLPTQQAIVSYAELASLAKIFSSVSYPTFLIYNVVFELSKFKATPGKMLCKIIVVDIDGKSLTIGSSLLKNMGVCISFLLYALPFLSALFSEHRQAWYERIAKSYQITQN